MADYLKVSLEGEGDYTVGMEAISTEVDLQVPGDELDEEAREWVRLSLVRFFQELWDTNRVRAWFSDEEAQ